MRDEKAMLEKLIEIGNMMTSIKNIDILMERILTEARKLVNADAGSFYLCDGNFLHFSYSQNETFQKSLLPHKKLIYSTFTIPVDLESISGYVAINGQILNIEDVYHIDQPSPFHFNPDIDKKSGYKTKSMLSIPLKNSLSKVTGVLQLINAKDQNNDIITFNDQDIPFLKHFANIASIALEKAEITRSIIMRMIKMAELRDPKETGSHVNRVAAYSTEIYEYWAKQHQVPEKKISHQKDLLRISAMLHDVGKIGITDIILKKPDKLTFVEFNEMKKHPQIGADLFSNEQSELDILSAMIALRHHERWDGTGYPGNLKGTEIPLLARIVSIADVFDALSTKRCYKDAWSLELVWEEILSQSGKQFDPELVNILCDISEIILSIKERYPD